MPKREWEDLMDAWENRNREKLAAATREREKLLRENALLRRENADLRHELAMARRAPPHVFGSAALSGAA